LFSASAMCLAKALKNVYTPLDIIPLKILHVIPMREAARRDSPMKIIPSRFQPLAILYPC
jgi:hypothetical protein